MTSGTRGGVGGADLSPFNELKQKTVSIPGFSLLKNGWNKPQSAATVIQKPGPVDSEPQVAGGAAAYR